MISILLANGFEEIEALAPLDVLRRLNYPVKLISMNENLTVTSSHNVKFICDEVFNNQIYHSAGVIIPGGMPGANNLRDDLRVIQLLQDFDDKKKLIAAICAGPIVLARANIIANEIGTAYPGFEKELNYLEYRNDNVVISNHIITSRGPSTAFMFAFAIAEYLQLDIKNLKNSMLFTNI